MAETESPFACDMAAIASELRESHSANIDRLFRSTEEMLELPDGYRFRLANNPGVIRAAAEFIALERLCCPFLGFFLAVEREGGAVWLSLTGREGVKPFIMAELRKHLPATIQR